MVMLKGNDKCHYKGHFFMFKDILLFSDDVIHRRQNCIQMLYITVQLSMNVVVHFFLLLYYKLYLPAYKSYR